MCKKYKKYVRHLEIQIVDTIQVGPGRLLIQIRHIGGALESCRR